MSKRAASGRRPKLLPISEEMKRWSETLGQDISGWPGVSSRPMFGLTAFYRDGAIFACLPKIRAMRRPNAISLKFDPLLPAFRRELQADPRANADDADARSPDASWFVFELHSDRDLPDALEWLGRAYEKAGKRAATATKVAKTAKVAKIAKVGRKTAPRG